MKTLLKIILVETKLFFRDPATWVVALLLPAIVLLILGILPGLNVPQEVFGGKRFVELFIPSLIVITQATLGVNYLPIRLTTDREKGVLRRLSTTPVKPGWYLAAQLLINLVMATAAVCLLLLVGRLAFAIPFQANLPGFLAAYLLGLTSMLALGMLVAAVAPSARAGAALAMPLYFLSMFLGGAYVPRIFLPDILVWIGQYTPPGVQGLVDAWNGISPQPLQLTALTAITVLSSTASARLFRWE
jgi:ABC-2 type transport system permease protein